jgi:hypothetical protein
VIAPLCGDPLVAPDYSGGMRHLALILVIAAILSACANAVIGPVDHSCAANPARSQGSGCDDGADGGGGGGM